MTRCIKKRRVSAAPARRASCSRIVRRVQIRGDAWSDGVQNQSTQKWLKLLQESTELSPGSERHAISMCKVLRIVVFMVLPVKHKVMRDNVVYWVKWLRSVTEWLWRHGSGGDSRTGRSVAQTWEASNARREGYLLGMGTNRCVTNSTNHERLTRCKVRTMQLNTAYQLVIVKSC